jgi:chromosome segregation ATPase
MQHLRAMSQSLKAEKLATKSTLETHRLLDMEFSKVQAENQHIHKQLRESVTENSSLHSELLQLGMDKQNILGQYDALLHRHQHVEHELVAINRSREAEIEALKETLQAADAERHQISSHIEKMEFSKHEADSRISALEEEVRSLQTNHSSVIESIQAHHTEKMKALHEDLGCAHLRLEAHQVCAIFLNSQIQSSNLQLTRENRDG